MFASRRPSLNAKETIARLVNTLSSATRIEDRRNALITLRGLGKDLAKDVALGSFDALKFSLGRGDGVDEECARAILGLLGIIVKVDVYGEMLVNDTRTIECILEMTNAHVPLVVALLEELLVHPQIIRILETSRHTSTLISKLDTTDDVLFISLCSLLNGLMERSMNVQNRIVFEGGFELLLPRIQNFEDDPALAQVSLEALRWMLQGNYIVQKQIHPHHQIFGLLLEKRPGKKIVETVDAVLLELSSCPCTHCIEPLSQFTTNSLLLLLERHQECKEVFGKLKGGSLVKQYMIDALNSEYHLECIAAWLKGNYQGQLLLLSSVLSDYKKEGLGRTVEEELMNFGKPKSNPKALLSGIKILALLMDDNPEAKCYLLQSFREEEESFLSQILLFLLLSSDLQDASVKDDVLCGILSFLITLTHDHPQGEARVWEEGNPLLQFLTEIACLDYRHRASLISHALILFFYLLARTKERHQQRINFIRQRYHSSILLNLLANVKVPCVKREEGRYRKMILELVDEKMELERLKENNRALMMALEAMEKDNEALLINSAATRDGAIVADSSTDTNYFVNETFRAERMTPPSTEENGSNDSPSTTNNKIITV